MKSVYPGEYDMKFIDEFCIRMCMKENITFREKIEELCRTYDLEW